VSNQIERLRYYDGEYLRSYDFTAEQAYHIEMRRRLNRHLHLHGIVYGLWLVQDAESLPPNGPLFFSISSGMAIDRMGREIYLSVPYPLSPENVLNRPGIIGSKSYEVWLCYRETQTGLPAAGYRDCNERNQYTRWDEGFEVILVLGDPNTPGQTRPDCDGVRLGTITLDASKQITGVSDCETSDKFRTYVGIRAQRLIAANEEKDTFFDMKALTAPAPAQRLPGYLDLYPGVFGHGNMFVKKNLVIGDDFKLDKNDKPKGENLPDPIPATGNLKVTSDLFLNGDFYGLVGGKWFLLKDYIQTLMPQTVIGSHPVQIPQSNVTFGHEDVEVPTKLSAVKGKDVVLAISDIEWRDAKDLPTFNNGAATIKVDPTLTDKGGGKFNLGIDWTVSPTAKINGVDALPVTKLIINYVVVFTP
jgi:hypothetical protein